MPKTGNNKAKKKSRFIGSFFICGLMFTAILTSSCTQIQMPKSEPFFAETAPPKLQELRWSNGKMPKSFDPARASAAPETDIVRAIYEGLTEIDPKLLKETPAVAEKWSASDDHRIWTFQLRKDARWSNGKRLTAADFVTSWQRLARVSGNSAAFDLFRNIAGMKSNEAVTPPDDSVDFNLAEAEIDQNTSDSNTVLRYQSPGSHDSIDKEESPTKAPDNKIGVDAIDDTTLKVTLDLPDKDFPLLVANPIFRPVYGDGATFEKDPLSTNIVTNGAFKLTQAGKDGVVLERSDSYWNKGDVKLERVQLIPKDTAEAALDAYKKGEVDAVTNAGFEPLALKLLAPFEDFRQTTHSALNYYEINRGKAPFNDRRVREALAISIDRVRVTDGELDGSTEPAHSFLPLGEKGITKLSFDAQRAKELLVNAGYPGGEGFPKIRLLINRNNTQQRVAKSVAKMWKQHLNLDTELIVKDPVELETIRRAGEYDLIRRGIVLPTADETVSLAAIFATNENSVSGPTTTSTQTPTPTPTMPRLAEGGPSNELSSTNDNDAARETDAFEIFTEQDALYELHAIPLYFPTSYSLVKPYVKGFDINGLDAPLLKGMSIDSEWRTSGLTKQ